MRFLEYKIIWGLRFITKPLLVPGCERSGFIINPVHVPVVIIDHKSYTGS